MTALVISETTLGRCTAAPRAEHVFIVSCNGGKPAVMRKSEMLALFGWPPPERQQVHAFSIASRNDAHSNEECALRRPLETEIPEGVSVQIRANQTHEWVLVLNFNHHAQQFELPGGEFFDVLQGGVASSTLELPVFGVAVLRRPKK